MIEFITGASGTGKTRLMFEKIKQFCSDNKEVCVLVPEQYSNDFDKKLYSFVGAAYFNNLLSLSFNSLARHLFQLYGDPNRNGEYAEDIAKMIIVSQAVAAAKSKPESLNFFNKRSSQNGFTDEVLKLITDMKHSGITSGDLFKISGSKKDKFHNKTGDIAAIYCEYERIMEEYGFKDDFDNIREASEIAALNGFFKGKCVFLDEFESFNADQIDMIKVIFSSASNVVITLRTDNVNAGDFTLFETVNNTYRQLVSICRDMNCKYNPVPMHLCTNRRFKSPDLEYLSEKVMRNLPCDKNNAPDVQNLRIFEARDMYIETEYVCAEIKKLIHSDSSLKYNDIAVISNNIEEYADILQAAFERYDIPFFLSIERSVNHTAIIVFFTSLIELLISKKFHSEQIFRLLRCGILDESVTDVSLLENFCYKWGIDGDIWNSSFNINDDNIEIIEGIRERTMLPIIALKKKIRKNISVIECCSLIYNYLIECGAERAVSVIMNSLIKSNRDHDAAELKRIWSYLMNMLDGIADTIGEKIMPFSELAALMRSIISRINYSVPPQTLDSVMTASARTARLNEPRVVFVIGAAEGDFPNNVNLHGLFSESEKDKLSRDYGIKISRPISDLAASERLIVYKSLSTASDMLYITYPRADLGGEAKYPAAVIAQIRLMFRDDKCDDSNIPDFYQEDRSRLFITDSMITPDFYAVTMKAAYYHYMQDRAEMTPAIAAIEKILLSDEIYRQKVTAVLSKSMSKSEYRVRTEIMEKFRNFKYFVISATDIEDYNSCHFKYFCKSFLNLKVPEQIDINELISGSLAHDCFRHIIGKGKSYFIGLSDEELCQEVHRQAGVYRDAELGGDFAKTPRFELFYNKLKDELTRVFIHTRNSLMASDFVPIDFEARFSDKKSIKLGFGNGNTVAFRGAIDRVDFFEKNGKKYIRIIDYKSSQKKIDVESLANGVRIQMLLYLFVSTEKNGIYSGYVPSGVLYTPVRLDYQTEEDSKGSGYDSNNFNKALKSYGLILDNDDVLEATEHGRSKFVDSKSIISEENMERLRNFLYSNITEIAELIHEGDVEANPLESACTYCGFSHICGKSGKKSKRKADGAKKDEVSEILGKSKKGGRNNGSD